MLICGMVTGWSSGLGYGVAKSPQGLEVLLHRDQFYQRTIILGIRHWFPGIPPMDLIGKCVVFVITSDPSGRSVATNWALDEGASK